MRRESLTDRARACNIAVSEDGRSNESARARGDVPLYCVCQAVARTEATSIDSFRSDFRRELVLSHEWVSGVPSSSLTDVVTPFPCHRRNGMRKDCECWKGFFFFLNC